MRNLTKGRLLLCTCVLLSLLNPFRAHAQGDQTKISVKLASGVTTGAWLHLPDDYNSTTTNYPLIIFLHGLGEAGTDVNEVLKHGLPKVIANGAKMQYTVGGKLFKFITVSPQITNGWASADMVQSILDDIKARYRVDASRVYLTGLSAGGYGTLNYVASGTKYSNNVAAIVPVSSAAIDATKVAGLCGIASSNVAVWSLCGSNDSFIDIQTSYITKINSCSPRYPAISTTYAGGTHSDNVWDKAYDAAHTYQSPNIYEWMLKYSQGSTGIVIPAPVAAVAAENIAITLPVSTATLDGTPSTAPSSTIASYAWSMVSGPSTPTFSSTSTAKITVSNLAAGTYIFRLTVKNAQGTSSTKQVTVVVTAATAIPAPVATITLGSTTITLPVSSTTLDGSASTASGSTIASYAWSRVSGPSTPTFSSTSTAKVTVSNLVAGSYVFNLTVKNAAGGTSSKQATLAVKAATTTTPAPTTPPATSTPTTPTTTSCANRKFLVKPGTDGGAYINGNDMSVRPGDTVFIQTGSYKYIQFYNFTGTATQPIVFMNCGGQVKVGSGGSYGFIFNNVKYFKVTGTGSTDKYGFSVNGVSTRLNVGLAMGKGCTDYEGDHFEIAGSEVGVMAKVNPDCETANQGAYFSIRNVKLHDLYIHDVTGEGMYVGNTAPNGTQVTCADGTVKTVYPPLIYGLRIYNVITANTGWDGIQVASAPQDVEIYNNKVTNYGTTNKGSQQAGIILGGLTNGKVYNNTVIKGTGNGIEVFGIGLCYVYNNIISDAGWDGSTARQDALFADDRPTKSNYVPLKLYAFNNTIVNSGRDAIRFQNSYGTVASGNQIYNNLLVAPGSFSLRGLLSYLSTETGINILTGNNLNYPFVASAKFVDAAGKNFHIATGSPAIDKGKDLSTYFRTDIDGNARPQGASFDVGADEFGSGTAVNVAPVASAGTDATITLPVATVTLNATGSSDPDGTIASYAWTQASGPVTSSIASATTANPVVTRLSTAGTYVFKLTVTDNKGTTATDQVTITVKAAAAANVAPAADAGTGVTITLPVSQASLSGAGKDTDGTVASYAWSQVSGPVTASIASGTTLKPVVSKLTTAGTYVFKLTVKDNDGATGSDQVTVIVDAAAAANQAPAADAGTGATITLPVSQASLSGAGKDTDGTIASYAWSQVSGPVTASITSGTTLKPVVSKLTAAGTYVFKLTVKDNKGATGSDQVSVIVKAAAAANVAPAADAGTGVTLTLPVSQASLSGAGKDTDGTIASYAWSQVSGPVTASIASGTTLKPTVSKLTAAGTYVFKLTVKDNDGATGSDQVTVIVNAAATANQAPAADAGTGATITLPVSQASLSGAGKDTDGTIASYAWSQVSGPVTTSIAAGTTLKPTVSGLTTAGTYVFKLTVKDNDGATGSDQVTVIVNAAATTNKAPVANAGADETITQPKNSTDASASGSTDSDGKIASYRWTQVSGPTTASIVSPTSVKTDLNRITSVGTYVFRLTVTDDEGATDTDDLSVVVKPNPANQLYANAGADKTVNYPSTNLAILDGTASYATNGGYVARYAWTQVSGPVTATILNTAAQQPTVTFGTTGTYVFRLTVTDTYNNTDTDDVTVIVGGATTADAKVLTTASVALYPNPVVSTLRVTLKLSEPANIVARIYNSDGVIRGTYYLGTITSIQKDIDVNSLATGLYILQITDGKTLNLSNKFMKAN